MTNDIYPPVTSDLTHLRRQLAPGPAAAFHAFGEAAFAEGALSTKSKQIIAVAVAHVTQCPYCIKGHTRSALRHGASREELVEAIWVAAEMRAGAAFAHSIIALAEMQSEDSRAVNDGESDARHREVSHGH